MTASPKTRERVRIGADHARWWVRQITFGNPYAKAIMMAVANYMNEDGRAWPGVSTLAQDTDIGEDTVLNRLRWLEQIGAIVMLKCWVDKNGRRNYDGTGRVTSSEIRFLFDADIEGIEAAAQEGKSERALRGAAKRSHEARSEVNPSDDSTISTRPHRGLNDDDLPPAGTRLAPDLPPTPAARIEKEEIEDSPPLPPSGGSEPPPDGWKEFESAYPSPILRQTLARQVWSSLTPAERDLATRAAAGYGRWLKQQRKPPNVLNAHLFLKERDAWAQYADGGTRATADYHSIEADSDLGKGLINLRRLGGAPEPIIREGKFLHAGETGPQIEAFAYPPDRAQWPFIDSPNGIAAWMGFFRETLKGLNRREIVTEHKGNRGFFAPWPFPPRKDGSTGPPSDSLSESESKAFTG